MWAQRLHASVASGCLAGTRLELFRVCIGYCIRGARGIATVSQMDTNYWRLGGCLALNQGFERKARQTSELTQDPNA